MKLIPIKNLLFVFGIIFTSTFGIKAQVGDSFPEIEGESLTEEPISVPESTKGKITIIGMAYSKRSESAIKSWYQPMFDKFVLKLGMFDKDYDVNMVFIPMYTGTKKLAYNATIKKLKESAREDLFPYVMFYKGDIDEYVDQLGMEDSHLPYFFVLDEEGTIIEMVKGMYSDQKMEKLEEAINE